MSRANRKRQPSEWVRTKDDAVRAVSSSLDEIRVLCSLYDSGNHYCARTLAAVIFRMLSDELQLLEIRRQCLLTSFIPQSTSIGDQNMLDAYPLVVTKLSSGEMEGKVELNPAHSPNPFEHSAVLSIWLEQPVYLEGLSSLERRKTGKPISAAAKLKRNIITRRDLLKFSRDETGAHFDRKISLEHLQLSHNYSQVVYGVSNQDGEEFNSQDHPDKFDTLGTYGASSIRAIANEILSSFAKEESNGKVSVTYKLNQP